MTKRTTIRYVGNCETGDVRITRIYFNTRRVVYTDDFHHEQLSDETLHEFAVVYRCIESPGYRMN